MRLILASSSPYRKALLERLRLPFEIASPQVDETPLPGETPRDLVLRLARAKAAAIAVAAADSEAWVIGSDQSAELDGQPLGKPGGREAATAQLALLSGKSVSFHTAVAVAGGDGQRHEAIDTTRVCMRTLSAQEIDRYIAAETPYDCAGSFKVEALGISLFEAVESRDPTALIGLPLIATARLLRQAGFALP